MKKIFAMLITALLVAGLVEANASSPPPRRYEPVSRAHSWKERCRDIGIIYVAQWVGYAATQPKVFAKIQGGDWVENVFEKGAVLWDGDEWYWNFAGHPYVGSEYYLYFRSRGYSRKSSAFGSLVASTIWEELTETFSEPFSFNDFVITPVAGSLLGYARERGALRLLHGDSGFKRFWGHVLWWETNFSFFEDVEVMPAVSPDGGRAGIVFTATW